MSSHRFNTGQDDSFEWVWRYADAMLMWPMLMWQMLMWQMLMWQMIVTQMSQNIFIIIRNRRYIETRYKASYHLRDMKRGFIL